MKKILIAVDLLLFMMLNAQVKIAVMDFEGKNVPQTDASALTDRLRAELFLTGKFVVLEREKMDAILKEQQFQLSGCTSDACVVEAGQLLAVEQMVSGSVSKVGQTYSVTARLISIEKGNLLGVGTCDLKGDIGDFITCLNEVAAQLAGNQSVQKPPLVNQTAPTIQIPPTNMKGVPNWYSNPPQSKEYYYEVGDANNISMKLAKVASDNSARDAIARVVEMKISNMLNNFMQKSSIGSYAEALEFASSVSIQVANTSRKECRIVRRQMKTEGSSYHAFSLAEYNLNSLIQHTLYEVRNHRNLYIEAKADPSFEDLKKEIQNLQIP